MTFFGGDIPPEFNDLTRMRAVHLGRGDHDHFYPEKQFKNDVCRLRDAGIEPSQTIFHGGHAPNDDYFAAAGQFIAVIG